MVNLCPPSGSDYCLSNFSLWIRTNKSFVWSSGCCSEKVLLLRNAYMNVIMWGNISNRVYAQSDLHDLVEKRSRTANWKSPKFIFAQKSCRNLGGNISLGMKRKPKKYEDHLKFSDVICRAMTHFKSNFLVTKCSHFKKISSRVEWCKNVKPCSHFITFDDQ